ncbi:hypothetical protein, variant 2 [Aphanomyces invadans]|uniref:Uncharacterized protein n=1 Tax=Aphanomyces invadans TaxID=157072 RepID=A0A024UB01_9STRA|nr:hypothetical protein, variant 2 [Aphanomyces invadans]ETW03370.1 hypothetical protein, variant 2 [Aphanomyces invadans]|eukprot:XP_008867599.1 hypothetical protein, variant 2 [Aphanomyces invadans]
MLVLKKWLHMWFLGHASEEDCHGDGDDAQVRVHVQVGTPPPQGCFGKPGLFVQVYVVDAMWADVLERHDAVLVGEVVSTVCGKDASIVDVVLPGEPWKTRRCQLGQGYLRAIPPEDFLQMKGLLQSLPVPHHSLSMESERQPNESSAAWT